MTAGRLTSSPKLFRAGALLLLLAAWTLLLWQLDDVPPGFQHDQTFNTLDALSIGRGNYPFYFAANFGRDPLGIYSAAAILRLAGDHLVWALRFSSVLWGMAGLAFTLALARRYLPPASALLAAGLMAGSYWFLFTARLGLEPAALFALAAGMVYFLSRAQTERTWRHFVAAGLMGGLSVNTYLAGRGLFGLLALLLGYEVVTWLGHRWRGRRGLTTVRGLLVSLLVMAAVGTPLLIYLSNRPGVGDLRVGALGGPITAAMAGDFGPLLANSRDTLAALLWRAPNLLLYHYNVPDRAVLLPVLALAFLLGLGVTLWRVKQREAFLLLAALLVGLLPNLITGADALVMRGVIALPPIFILVAIGLREAGIFVARRLPSPWTRAWPVAAALAAVALLAWQGVSNGYAYFVTWAQAEPTQRIYNADYRAVAAYLVANPPDEPVYIGSDRLPSLDSLTYRLYSSRWQDVRWFPAGENLPLPRTGQALYFLPTSVDALSPTSSLLVAVASDRFTLPGPRERYDLVHGLRLSVDDVAKVMQSANARPLASPAVFGEALRLEAAGARRQDDVIELFTQWTVVGPWPFATPSGQPPQPIKFSVSLVDGAGLKWAQSDQPTHLPWTFWRPGDVYVELTRLPLPADLPPDEYTVRLALYDDVGGTALASTGAAAWAADAPVATMRIASPVAGAPPAAPYPVDQTAGSALALLGKWEPLELLVAGVPSDVHLSWQATGDLPTQDLTFRAQAQDEAGNVLWEQSFEPRQALPATWPAGQVYRLTHPLAPQTTPAGAGAVRLEVCALKEDVELACGVVGRPQVIDQPPMLALPRLPQHAVDADWDGQLTLAGYDLAQEPDKIDLTLYWQVDTPPAAPLKRFVHVLDAAGRVVAQSDAIPANGMVPMASWRVGEYVVDQLQLPLATEAGGARLCLGWYQPDSGERLAVRLPTGAAPADRTLCVPLEAGG